MDISPNCFVCTDFCSFTWSKSCLRHSLCIPLIILSFYLWEGRGGSCQGNQSAGLGVGRNDTAPIAHNPALLLTVSSAMMGGVRDKTGKRSDGVPPSQPRPCQHVSTTFSPPGFDFATFPPAHPRGKNTACCDTDFSLSPFADIHPSMLMRKQLLVWSFSTDKTRPPAEISRWGVGWDEQLLIIQTTGIKQRVPPHCSAHRLILNLIYCLTSMNITFSAGCDSSHSRSTVFLARADNHFRSTIILSLNIPTLVTLKAVFQERQNCGREGTPHSTHKPRKFFTPHLSVKEETFNSCIISEIGSQGGLKMTMNILFHVKQPDVGLVQVIREQSLLLSAPLFMGSGPWAPAEY